MQKMGNDSQKEVDVLKNSEKYLSRQLGRKMWVKDPVSGRFSEVAALEGVFMKMIGQAVEGCLVSQDKITKIAISQSEKLKDAFKEKPSYSLNNDTINILLQAGIEVPESLKDVTPVESLNNISENRAMTPSSLDLI